MQKNIRILLVLLSCCSLALAAVAGEADQPIYSNDFEKADEGPVPEGIMVLAGAFAVRREGSQKYLELAGVPLESYGVVVGREEDTAGEIRARIRAEATGRRCPEFGVGLGGPSGYRLWLMPAVGELQLIKGDKVKARAPVAWRSGEWVVLRLSLQPAGEGKWVLAGKVWEDGKPEPEKWMISVAEMEQPTPGRASLWGTPYSEKPVGFDDVAVSGKRVN